MSARYQVRLKNQAGEQVALITDESPIFKSFYCTRQKNAPGLCRFEIDGASHEMTLFEVDSQIELLRSVPDFGVDWYVEWEGFFVSPNRATLEDGTQTFVAYGATYLDLARREEIGYYAGTAYVAKSGPGETVIKQFVNENIGPGAGSLDRVDDGTMSGLVVQADEGRGALWEGSRAWKPLLGTIQEIAEATGLVFDIIGTGPATFAFTVYEGQRGLDRSIAGLISDTGLNAAGFEPVIFALERDNMLTPSLSISRSDEVNVVYVLGQGTQDARQVQVVKDPASIALSPWNRRAETRNANQETTASALIAVGEAQLQERLAQPSFDFAPLQVEGSSYGEHYFFGDLVTVKYEEVEANVEITGMQLTVNDQGEALRFSFGPLRAVAPGDVRKQQVVALTRIDERVSHLESLENSGGGGGGGITFAAAPTSVFNVTGSGTPSIALSMDTQAANLVLAGPTSGGPAVPYFRALETADIPQLAHSSLSGLSTGDDHTQYLLRQPSADWTIDASALRMGAVGGAAVVAQKLTIYTGADANKGVQIRQFSATHSGNLAELTGSTGTLLSAFGPTGLLGVGVAPSTTVTITATSTFVDAVTQAHAGLNSICIGAPTSNSAGSFIGVIADARLTTDVNLTASSGGLRGISNTTRFSGAGTVSLAQGNLSVLQHTGLGTITTFNYFHALQPTVSGGGLIGTINGFKVENIGASGITTAIGLNISGQSGAASNFAIVTNAGNVVFNEGGDSTTVIRGEGDTDQYLFCTRPATDAMGFGTNLPNTKVHGLLTDAGTNAVVNVLTVGHDTSGTAVAGFGTGLIFEGESSTTASQSLGRLTYEYVVATHASRVVRGKLTSFDFNGEREAIRWESNGTVPLLGLFGVNAVVRPTALTTQLTTITHTAPGTPDYAIQNLTNVLPFGFVTQDEGNSLLSVVANLQIRMSELETRMQGLGALS